MTDSPSLLVRALWFLFVGWWLTGLWLTVSWLLAVTVIGLPFAIMLINRVPKVLTLKERPVRASAGEDGTVATGAADQHGLVLRGVYFLLVGWWASGIWMSVAYGFALTVVGHPVAVWMFNQLPYVVSLYRY
ncbi:hypothetical protein JCM17823_25770 [Halorubrum gandharaense]